MVDFAKIKELADKAAATGKNMNEAQQGGGDYTPPEAGPVRLRFISYVELGKQPVTYQGKPNGFKDKSLLTFELSGPKHPPTEGQDGKKHPMRLSIEVPTSLNEKAHFYKLFRALNHAGKATHIAQLLGEAYKGTVVHRKYKGRDGKERIEAELFDKVKGGYTIEAPRYEIVDENGPTGEFKQLPVDPPLSPIRLFLWDLADKEQWDSLFIEGEYPERKDKDGNVTAPAKSKNVLQAKVKLANNFKGSPVYAVIAANGGSLDIPDAEDGRDPDAAPDADDPSTGAEPAAVTPTGAAATDSLNAVSGQPSLGM